MEDLLHRLESRHGRCKKKKKETKSSSEQQQSVKKISCTDAALIQSRRIPFGNFQGDQIYRNRIANAEPAELAESGHYSIEELVLPNCTSALCTTFSAGNPAWLQQVFANVDRLLVMKPPPKSMSDNTNTSLGLGPTIGNAKVSQMERRSQEMTAGTEKSVFLPITDWFWVQARPNTGGCLHAKVMLFRSSLGLRVVICGGNLRRWQWMQHRDCFFVQDFPVADRDDRVGFGDELFAFFTQVTRCETISDQNMVTARINEVFDKVDFSAARAKLVISFPRTKTETETGLSAGGWKHLSIAVHDALVASGMGERDENIDSQNSQPTENMAGGLPNIVYSNSGSMGNIQPDFLLQMYQAMNGKQEPAPRSTTWEDVVQRVRCMWPSIATACKTDLLGLKGCSRHIPRCSLNDIKRCYRNIIFRDAIPNPQTLATFQEPWKRFGMAEELSDEKRFHPATHGKFLWNDVGVLYVGSHNFSKAAWGLHNASPKNVEVGIVIATPRMLNGRPNPTYELWKDRLPCKLNAESSPYYAAYAGLPDLINQHPYGGLWKRVYENVANKSFVPSEAGTSCPSPALGDMLCDSSDDEEYWQH